MSALRLLAAVALAFGVVGSSAAQLLPRQIPAGYAEFPPAVVAGTEKVFGLYPFQSVTPLPPGLFNKGTGHPRALRFVVRPHDKPTFDLGREVGGREYDRLELEGSFFRLPYGQAAMWATSQRVSWDVAALKGTFNVIQQIHTTDSATCGDPIISAQLNTAGNWRVQLYNSATSQNDYHATTPYSVNGVWIDTVWRVKFAGDNTGSAEVWRRRWPLERTFTKVLDLSGVPVGCSDESFVYFKTGLYRNTPRAALVTGSIAGTTMTVTAKSAGYVAIGSEVVKYGDSEGAPWPIPPNTTYVAEQLPGGTPGGAGTYRLTTDVGTIASGALNLIDTAEVVTVELANYRPPTTKTDLSSLLTCDGCWRHPH